MKPSFLNNPVRRLFIFFVLIIVSQTGFTQTSETFSSGSFIINMGATNPNTIGNGLKPYGLIYDLVRNYNIPVKAVINPAKVKDGVDFTYNAIQYKGGTFIINAEYRTTAVNNRITYWTGQGVAGTSTTSALTLAVTKTIESFPKWTLDARNGKIAEGFLINAGITNTAFPGAYNWKAPALLTVCDDYFVMPHADPVWSTHGNLWIWNKDALGAVWAGCHAVSVLENMTNPLNATQKTNFLSTTGLLLFGSHGKGSPPYTDQFPTEPVAQYMGKTELAMQNGSEQIFMPKPGGAWNPGVKIIAYDPTQADIPSKSPGPAVSIAFGRGMDDPGRGYVMYEGGHSINKGSANDVAAQRAFFNFSFYNTVIKNPQLTVTGITAGQEVSSGTTLTGLNVVATSAISGTTFTYEWSNGCGGSFSNPTSATTNFTAPVVSVNTFCTITCKVTDNCGRSTFHTYIVIVLANRQPTPNNDAQVLDPGCGSASLTYNVLTNDTDPDGQPLSLTNVTGVANGTISFTAAGNITYTPNPGFFGVEALTYTVCDNSSPAPFCANASYTITVGNIANVPNTGNDAFTIAEDIIGTFNVVVNDIPVVSGPLTVSAITSGPANGRVSINTDNTITYVPNTDFAGTDNFTYRLVNSLGYSKTAAVSVTVTDNGCNAGTYQTGTTIGSVTLNAIADAEILNNNAGNENSNYGNCNKLYMNGSPINPKNHDLVRFDLSGIPSNATVTSADLRLVKVGGANSSRNVSFHRITSNWTEGTGGCGGSNGGVASWLNRLAATPWTTAGGDCDPAPAATIAVSTDAAYTWSITALAESWVNGTNPNFGILGRFTTENLNSEIDFASRENNTLGNRPTLAVAYTVPVCSAIPNRAPMAMPDTASTANGTALNIATAANDYFPVAGAVTYSIITPPASGSAIINGSGVITYTPAGTFNGIRALTYQVTHTASGLLDQAIVYINITNGSINAVNDNPAGDSSGIVQTINVKANDTDPEGQVAASTVTITGLPNNGTATVNGSSNIVYTPNTGYTGNDTLYYSLCEAAPPCGTAFCDTARVVIRIFNRPPTGNDDVYTVLPCNAVTFNITNNDTDPEGNLLTVISLGALSPLAAGTITNNNDGTVTFVPAVGFTGVATFTYTLTDNGVPPQTSAPATVTINVVIPVPNNPPVAVNDEETINMDETLYYNVTDNDYDPDNNPLTIPQIMVAPLNGTATVNPVNGLIEYIPNPGYIGSDILTYRICDIPTINVATCSSSPDLCATATLSITIITPIILPVKLLAFNGKRVGKNNILEWSTAQEANSKHFELENSTDNSSFTRIATVMAKGNSTLTTNYSHTHTNPVAAVNYYRLKFVDLDGSSTMSKTIAIKNEGTSVTLNTVYPSPFKDRIELSITAISNEKIDILIYDPNGRRVRAIESDLAKGLNVIAVTRLNSLASGIYFIEIKTSKTSLRTKVFKANSN